MDDLIMIRRMMTMVNWTIGVEKVVLILSFNDVNDDPYIYYIII
jgi:hypothetical protein